MKEKSIKIILNRIFGCLFIIIGIILLFIKLIREYIPMVEPYSLELFLISPIFIVLGCKVMCRNVKIRIIKIGSNVLFAIAVFYFIILSASWVIISTM